MRLRIQISGVVQGVGFRPLVWKRVREFGLTGWVNNRSSRVTIEVQGNRQSIEDFIDSFRQNLPPLAKIDSFNSDEISSVDETEFVILASIAVAKHSIPVSPEISVCADCLREISDANDRRFRYPFINCTNCGPRFTIVEDTPYDRPLTTMKSFPMCKKCRGEYEDPYDRRFHAQPNACHDCGPQIWFVDGSSSDYGFSDYRMSSVPTGEAAIAAFQTAIRSGEVVAVKGIGGFHLACDATSEQAISTLRERKGRIDKPFAVMVPDGFRLHQSKSFARLRRPLRHQTLPAN